MDQAKFHDQISQREAKPLVLLIQGHFSNFLGSSFAGGQLRVHQPEPINLFSKPPNWNAPVRVFERLTVFV
jgi:hypothetical protein